MKFAKVIIDQDAKALDREFEYIIPEELPVLLGQRVNVPFGKRTLQGFVVNISDTADYDETKLKRIENVLEDFAVIKPEMLELMKYMQSHLHLNLASVLRLFLPSEMRTGKVKELVVRYAKLNDLNVTLPKSAKKQAELVELLKERGSEKTSELGAMFGYNVLSTLEKKGIISIENVKKMRSVNFDKREDLEHELTPLQKRAVETIGNDGVYLLHGVTGSGKTEVYMHLIERCLREGKTALMLVPEISLTPQVLSNFKARFGEEVALIHSGLSAGERFDEWRRIFFGEAKVVVGARSAIFSPIENLGVIIIDEEHEQSYISESNPRYDTHDIAEFRRKYNNCSLVFGSATPSIDSYTKALEGEYKLVEMPVRVNGMEMPKIKIVDMMGELREGNSEIFSVSLLAELDACIKQKKQAMIFINRRGFSSFQRCRDCGYVAKCTDCDVSLVYHKFENKLKCHYCGKRYRALDICPSCGSHNIKQGAIGTERVVTELKRFFGDVPIFRMDNDTTSTKDAHRNILGQFRTTKPAILVGTQMIAKGHDFEDVVLVGIVDADQSLYQADYRSIEKTFQLITQVSGRAGRSKDQGKVILQTYSPRHYVYRFAENYDYKGFFKKELNLRKVTQFPPYTKIIRILFSHENENIVAKDTKVCYNKIQELKEKYKDDFVYLDAMKSPVNRIKTQYRYQILMRIKLENIEAIEKEIYSCVDCSCKSSVFYEINPTQLS